MKTILPWHILKDRRFFLLLLFLSSTFSVSSLAQHQAKGSLHITFTEIRSDVGLIRIGIYSSDKEWIHHPKYSHKWDKSELKGDRLRVVVDDLPYGSYSISVLDDEDRSNSMNYKLKLPQEGWGMSNNPSFLKLKQPGYDECSFKLDSPKISMEIKLNYLNKRKKIK